MRGRVRYLAIVGVVLGALMSALAAVSAADAPDFTKFGYPTVGATMDVSPDQAVTITAGNQSVAIKAGTFDNPVTFDLLTATPASWQSQVSGRTVRAAFAFRVTDKTTKAILGTFKQPVVYTYSGTDGQSSDAILNTSAATPAVITPNPAPVTFESGKVSHPFTGAGVGWLVVSAASSAGTSTAGTNVAAAPAATTPAGAAATRPASAPAATGTGGGTVLPTTGVSASGAAFPWFLLLVIVGGGALTLGVLLRRRNAAR